MLDEDRVLEAVYAVIAERFSDVDIVDVSIKCREDFSDENTIEIKVIFNAEGGKLEPGLMSGLVRHLAPELKKVDVDAFPIMRYIAADEAEVAA